jgi:hypothetical protein
MRGQVCRNRTWEFADLQNGPISPSGERMQEELL